jgi:cytochrome oxidase assembly protein ShyY1
MDGRMGAWAVSVLRYQDASGAPRFLAVQRGWAAQSQPMHAPDIAGLTAAAQTLEGQLVDYLPKAFALQTVQPNALGLWQNHDLNHHGAVLGIMLQPQVLVLSTSSPDAEAQQLRRIPAQQAVDALLDKANKNRGYAVQWLGLGCVGVFGLLWMWRQHRAVKPSSISTNHVAP